MCYNMATCAESSYELQAEQTFQDYTVRTYYEYKTGKGKFEIFQNDRQVYQKHSDDLGKFFIGHLYDDKEEYDLIAMGNDITGNGIPNLVISEWTGGAHCCYNIYVFEIGTNCRYLATIEAEHGDLSYFADLDGDKNLEFIGADWTFAYWSSTSFAQSPTPQIILCFRDGAYVLADDLMRKPAPSAALIEAKLQEIQTSETWLKRNPPRPPEVLWEFMLDLIYSGHADLAWQFFEKAWPSQFKGKKERLEEFRSWLAKSPYWPQIKNLQANE